MGPAQVLFGLLLLCLHKSFAGTPKDSLFRPHHTIAISYNLCWSCAYFVVLQQNAQRHYGKLFTFYFGHPPKALEWQDDNDVPASPGHTRLLLGSNKYINQINKISVYEPYLDQLQGQLVHTIFTRAPKTSIENSWSRVNSIHMSVWDGCYAFVGLP